MLEHAILRLKNWEIRQREKAASGEVDVFVPANRNAREISEAMLLDGALPSDINKTVISLLDTNVKEEQEKAEKQTAIRLDEIRDSLLLETDDQATIEKVVAQSELGVKGIGKYVDLNPFMPFRKVNIEAYDIPQKTLEDKVRSAISFFQKKWFK